MEHRPLALLATTHQAREALATTDESSRCGRKVSAAALVEYAERVSCPSANPRVRVRARARAKARARARARARASVGYQSANHPSANPEPNSNPSPSPSANPSPNQGSYSNAAPVGLPWP
jgi:hypothetical protein